MNPKPARSASGLILPDGFKCEQCGVRDAAIAHLTKQLKQLAGEVDRMRREVGSALANRAERRDLLRRKRGIARGRRPKTYEGRRPTWPKTYLQRAGDSREKESASGT